ncbi:MAG: CPBP family intramembrane metalloprotease [Actinomycetaceae bacterium]|nr:CPBP family intramembrane metalloprotease [Actinomycetaceae bacterium]
MNTLSDDPQKEGYFFSLLSSPTPLTYSTHVQKTPKSNDELTDTTTYHFLTKYQLRKQMHKTAHSSLAFITQRNIHTYWWINTLAGFGAIFLFLFLPIFFPPIFSNDMWNGIYIEACLLVLYFCWYVARKRKEKRSYHHISDFLHTYNTPQTQEKHFSLHNEGSSDNTQASLDTTETFNDQLYNNRFTPRVSLQHLLFMACLVIIFWAVGVGSATTLNYYFPDKTFEDYSTSMTSAGTIALLISSIVIAPLIEEILFRALLLDSLIRSTTPVRAIIISSAIFTILHGTWTHILFTFSLSVLLSLIYLHTGNVVYTIGGHFLFNTLSNIPYLSIISLPFLTPITAIAGNISLIFFIITLWKKWDLNKKVALWREGFTRSMCIYENKAGIF